MPTSSTQIDSDDDPDLPKVATLKLRRRLLRELGYGDWWAADGGRTGSKEQRLAANVLFKLLLDEEELEHEASYAFVSAVHGTWQWIEQVRDFVHPDAPIWQAVGTTFAAFEAACVVVGNEQTYEELRIDRDTLAFVRAWPLVLCKVDLFSTTTDDANEQGEVTTV